MKKKIIFVTKALWIGGIETALVNLLKYFNYDKYGNWTEMTTTSTYPKNIGAYIKRTFNYRSE